MNNITIKGLKIQNVGIIEDVDIPFDCPLLLFYGDIGQGKSTILKAVGWLFGGAFPSDIIRHGQKEALIEMKLGDGFIRREFYLGKEDVAKARDITFIRGGRPVPRPVGEIKRLLNPFLEDQDYLMRMGETERKAYFAQMFAVDTSVLDTEYYEKDSKASRLRTRIDSYGHIDLTPVPPSNAEELREILRQVREVHASQVAEWTKEVQAIRRDYSAKMQQRGQGNVEVQQQNSKRDGVVQKTTQLEIEIEDLRLKLAEAEKAMAAANKWLEENPRTEFLPEIPEPDTAELDAKIRSQPDTSALEKQLEEATRNEERHKQLEANQERAKQKATEEAELKGVETRLREIKKEKVAKLSEVSAKSGIPGLEFDEKGILSYEGTQAGMLSTSQLMRLSSQLSAMYPKGLGIELIDRAESLGKSIFGFIDRAKKEDKTILATIVGEAPAQAPDEVGVFVVDAGKVTAKPKRAKSAEQPKSTQDLI